MLTWIDDTVPRQPLYYMQLSTLRKVRFWIFLELYFLVKKVNTAFDCLCFTLFYFLLGPGVDTASVNVISYSTQSAFFNAVPVLGSHAVIDVTHNRVDRNLIL